MLNRQPQYAPRCPKCDGSDAKAIDKVPSFYGAASGQHDSPTIYTVAYLCPCGASFVETVQVYVPSPSGPQIATAMLAEAARQEAVAEEALAMAKKLREATQLLGSAPRP